MAAAMSSLVTDSLTRAASLSGDFLPVLGLALALPLFAAVAFFLRDFFGG